MTLTEFYVAILKNYSVTAEFGQLMLDEIASEVRQSNPSAVVNVYSPNEGTAFPDPSSYDLIILTGGLFNLLGEERPSWVTETLVFIREVYLGQTKAKILGICWGHQAIALALGGSLAESDRGPCVRSHISIKHGHHIRL